MNGEGKFERNEFLTLLSGNVKTIAARRIGGVGIIDAARAQPIGEIAAHTQVVVVVVLSIFGIV